MLCTLIAGMDFYSFSNRQILAENKTELNRFVFNQLTFNIFSYLVLLPVYSLFLFFIDMQYWILFFLLLFFEYLCTEFFRLFTVLGLTLQANFIHFLKSGVWCIPLIVTWYFYEDFYLDFSLYIIYLVWFIGTILAFIYAVFTYYKKYQPKKKDAILYEKTWFKNGLKVAAFFFTITITNKIIEIGGRYFIEFFLTTKEVGIYSFFSQISSVVSIFVFTACIMVMYPQLITAKEKGDYYDYLRVKKKFRKQVLVYGIISSLLAVLLIYPLLNYIGKEDLIEYIPVFYIILGAVLILNISYIGHYTIYTFKFDKFLFKSNIILFAVNCLLYLLIYFLNIINLYTIALIQLITYLFLLTIKTIKSYSITKSYKLEAK